MKPIDDFLTASDGIGTDGGPRPNGYLGISLSRNVYFSKARVAGYVDWAAHHLDRLLIVVADHLEAYNIQVLRAVAFDVARSRAVAKGRELVRGYTRAIPPALGGRMVVRSAADILVEPGCAAVLARVERVAAEEAAFRADLSAAVSANLLRRSGKTSTADADRRDRILAGVATLSRYVVEELAIVLYLAHVAVPRWELAIFPESPHAAITNAYRGAYAHRFTDLTGSQPFRFVQLTVREPSPPSSATQIDEVRPHA